MVDEPRFFVRHECRLVCGPGEEDLVDHRFEGCHDQRHHRAGDGEHQRSCRHLPQVGAHVSQNSLELGHALMVALRPPNRPRLFGFHRPPTHGSTEPALDGANAGPDRLAVKL